jgi:hypothetical protein
MNVVAEVTKPLIKLSLKAFSNCGEIACQRQDILATMRRVFLKSPSHYGFEDGVNPRGTSWSGWGG